MLTQKHYEKRLLKLCDFLESLPRRRFDFGVWGESVDGSGDYLGHPECLDKNVCGTVGCALGWATALPYAKDGRRSPRVTLNDVLGDCLASAYALYGRQINTNLFLPECYLGLDPDGQRIYMPEESATPKQVAKAIRRAIKLGLAFNNSHV